MPAPSVDSLECFSLINCQPQSNHGTTNAITPGFGGSFWRNTILTLAVSIAAYRVSTEYTPAAQGADLSHSHDPNAQPIEGDDKSMPFLTRYIAHHMPREGIWKERNSRHLELSVKQAEDQLLIQEAQKPPVRRLRYPGMFEQASPHCESRICVDKTLSSSRLILVSLCSQASQPVELLICPTFPYALNPIALLRQANRDRRCLDMCTHSNIARIGKGTHTIYTHEPSFRDPHSSEESDFVLIAD